MSDSEREDVHVSVNELRARPSNYDMVARVRVDSQDEDDSDASLSQVSPRRHPDYGQPILPGTYVTPVVRPDAAYEIITPKPPLLPEDDMYDKPAMAKSQLSAPASGMYSTPNVQYSMPAPQPPGQYSMPDTVPQPADVYTLMGYAHHTVEAPGPSVTYNTLDSVSASPRQENYDTFGGDSASASPRQQNYDALGGGSASTAPRQQNYDTLDNGALASSAVTPVAHAGSYDRLGSGASPSCSNTLGEAEYSVAVHMAPSTAPCAATSRHTSMQGGGRARAPAPLPSSPRPAAVLPPTGQHPPAAQRAPAPLPSRATEEEQRPDAPPAVSNGKVLTMGKAPPSVSSLLTQFTQLSAVANAGTNVDEVPRASSQAVSNATEFVRTNLKGKVVVQLKRTEFSVTVLNALCRFLCMPECIIQTLWIAKCGLGDRGTRLLGDALAKNRTVVRLGLPGNDISNEGAAAIAHSLSTSAVTHLELKLNAIGPTGLNALTAALQKGGRVTYLGIDTCTLSAAQAQALAEIFMVEKGALEEISLKGSNFDGQCLAAFVARLIRHPSPVKGALTLDGKTLAGSMEANMLVKQLQGKHSQMRIQMK